MIYTKIFDPPEWNRREILRYAGIRGADGVPEGLLDECMRESENALCYRVCYTLLDAAEADGGLRLGGIFTASKTVKKAIRGADKVLLFAATVGTPFDRLIQRFSSISPSKALIFQAIGAERVESLCDMFCAQMNEELSADGLSLTPRVSPGYGDIDLSMQRDIFAVLDCPRKIGLTLDDSLLMSPSKSVTALCGIVGGCEIVKDKCSACEKLDCIYRDK